MARARAVAKLTPVIPAPAVGPIVGVTHPTAVEEACFHRPEQLATGNSHRLQTIIPRAVAKLPGEVPAPAERPEIGGYSAGVFHSCAYLPEGEPPVHGYGRE